MAKVRIAIIGAGAIGRTHIEAARKLGCVTLCGLLDPSPAAADLAAEHDCQLYANLDSLIADAPGGVVIATPNALHEPMALALIAAGIPILVEKPLAQSATAAERIANAAADAGVPGLVGHHRRYNPILRAAKAAMTDGFGDVVSGSVTSTLYKPDSYFDVAWHCEPGNGGPLLINAIHEIDLIRHLCGEIASVSALASHGQRALPVEDTAAVLFRLKSGGLVTLSLTDAGVGPWAWDIAAGENLARFPAHKVVTHMFSGQRAALSLPDLTLWRFDGAPDWTQEQISHPLEHPEADAYDAQLSHFADLISGQAEPMVSLQDGARNLRVIEAIHLSASESREVEIAGSDADNVKPDGNGEKETSPCPA